MSFFDTKNLSPRSISVFTALIIALVNVLLSLILKPHWYIPILVFAITFIVVYYIYQYTLQRFIYRKIKLIYKLIYHTKATKREEFFYENILPQKSLDDVGNDVENWAISRSKEIEDLQNNEQFRKEFLMNVAHELRTPIFTVQGYIDTLLAGALKDDSVNEKFLKNASKGIERLARLVDDLNEISQLEVGLIPLEFETFSIQQLLQEVFEQMALKAKERNIHLAFKKGTEGSITVNADKQKIKQVVFNLVENALKYGIENGTLTAGCYLIDDKHVYVELSDDGPGIAEEHLPRIFERFYRTDKSRNNKTGGTGLGLSIVKHIIEAHGHTVTARSTVGVGSSFGFTLDKGND